MQRNIAANYVSLVYVMAAGVVAVPIYLRLMGPEAYGLIGFFTLLTAGFQLFDVGLSQTLARECARFRGGALGANDLRRLLATFERIFLGVAVTGALAVILGAGALASDWLHVERLSLHDVTVAVMLMGVAVPCLWVSGLYRGVLIGFERQILLSTLTVVLSTARYFGVIAALLVWGASPTCFFAYQAAIAVIELGVLVVLSRRLLPQGGADRSAPLPWRELKRVLAFSSAIAFSIVAWMALTQGDKLILSRILSLADYGVFTLAAVASGAVAGLGIPIEQAILPRLTKLNAEGEVEAATDLYRRSTQLVCLTAFPAALLLACFADPVIQAWTGDTTLVPRAAPILRAYAIGSGLMTVSAFPYYLQYSRGTLRLHVIGQALLLLILAPALTIAATRNGAVGAGLVWTALNAAYLLVWTPVVHRTLAPGLHWRWLLQDIAPIAAATAASALMLSFFLRWPDDRLAAFLQLIVVAGCIFGAGVIASWSARLWLRSVLRRLAS